MDRLEFDFNIAKKQEMRIQEMYLRLKSLTQNDYNDSIAELRQAWEGEESGRYFQKMQRQHEKMLDTSATLKHASEALHEARVRAEIAEEKAKEIAENRIYK